MEKLSRFTFILGIILVVFAYFIPYDSMEFLLGQGLRPMGLVSIIINPILGIIGIVSSTKRKQLGYLVLNLCLLFSFFFVMGIGYLISGIFS